MAHSAENGCFIKTRPTRSSEPGWVNMVANFNLIWKASCLEILHYVCIIYPVYESVSHMCSVHQFTERTPGSFIEEREASVVWRYWTGSDDDPSSDRQWARRQAAEAQNHVFDRYVCYTLEMLKGF